MDVNIVEQLQMIKYICMNISGKLIKINEKITSSDLRIIKWLTGFTVDCEFSEKEFINIK
jgi:hypothetical protein